MLLFDPKSKVAAGEDGTWNRVKGEIGRALAHTAKNPVQPHRDWETERGIPCEREVPLNSTFANEGVVLSNRSGKSGSQ